MPTEPRSAIELVTKGSQEWRDVREMFIDAQAGLCAICREPFTAARAAHLDHCHATGFVRGALCTSCNVKLGWLEKRRRAIETYLATAGEFAAAAAPRLPRMERWRQYWQSKPKPKPSTRRKQPKRVAPTRSRSRAFWAQRFLPQSSPAVDGAASKS